MSDSERASSSKDTVLYACDCANCKGALFCCYSTIRRHRSIFGVHTQALGISCNTREATFAGGLTLCLWPVGFVCGSV